MKSIAAAYLLGSLRKRPSDPGEIQSLLGCSRATAYRWLKRIRDFDDPERINDRDIDNAFKDWMQRA